MLAFAVSQQTEAQRALWTTTRAGEGLSEMDLTKSPINIIYIIGYGTHCVYEG